MSAKALMACGVLLLVLGSGRADDPGKLSPANLVGTWTYVSGEKDGDKANEADLKKASVIFTKSNITLKGEQGDFVLKYELHASKSPATIAMEITEGPAGQGAKAEGIIELKDDTLRICYPAMGGKTPTEFRAPKDSGLHYFVLKRKK
jgi:uncharacterized protein (TIGR03067 family)